MVFRGGFLAAGNTITPIPTIVLFNRQCSFICIHHLADFCADFADQQLSAKSSIMADLHKNVHNCALRIFIAKPLHSILGSMEA